MFRGANVVTVVSNYLSQIELFSEASDCDALFLVPISVAIELFVIFFMYMMGLLFWWKYIVCNDAYIIRMKMTLSANTMLENHLHKF